MKKILSVLMTIAMLASMPFAAMAEEPEVDTLLEGIVTEIVDGGFVMEDAEQGEVMLNTSEATVFDGILIEGELTEGQYVFVEYDGRMTFSLPPQAHADRVVCNVLTGSVTEVLEDGSILMTDDTFGETIVHLSEGMNHVYAGMPITVYYDGVMTLSLPGEANASHILIPELTGTVSGKTEEGFTLTDAFGTEYQVLFSEESLISEILPAVEEEETTEEITEEAAEETTEEIAEDVIEETAEEIVEDVTEETAEAITEEFSEEEIVMDDAEQVEEIILPSAELLSESAIEWADGDTVTVYYNGMMSRSIPAQITAMEIVVIR